MPFYKVSEMAESHVAAQPMGRFKGLAGELMKVGFVTYTKGEGATPNYHPNEEQFILILEGKQWMIVGDEEKLIGPGDLVHIPRGAKHGGVIIDEVRMFTVKSPSGDGSLDQDHNEAPDAEEVIERLESKLDELSGEGPCFW